MKFSRRLSSLMLVISTLLILPHIARAETIKSSLTPAISSTAIFAGGCFWCMESEFSHKKGISDVTSGYAGGPAGKPPSYEEVSSGTTGFKESIKVTYDPQAVSYKDLLDIFWSNVDPFDDKGQFCDKGTQYQAAIFTNTPTEQKLAESSLKDIEKKFGKKVATQIVPTTTFYPAENYHQDFADNNAVRYNLYKNGCGRPQTLKQIWGDKAEKD